MASLTAACPELAAALVGGCSRSCDMVITDAAAAPQSAEHADVPIPAAVVTDGSSCTAAYSSRTDSCCVQGAGGAGADDDGCVVIDKSSPSQDVAASAAVQRYRIAAVDVLDLSAAIAQQGQPSHSTDAQQPRHTSALTTGHQQVAPHTAATASALVVKSGSADQAGETASAAGQLSTTRPTAGALELSPAAAAHMQITAGRVGGSQAVAALQQHASPRRQCAVIPLPYAHYQLVGEDGRPLERPDKHPFALSRVLYDAR